MSGRPPEEIRLEVVISAGASAVWDALANADQRRLWWPHMELDARPGGRLVERWRTANGVAMTTRGAVLTARRPEQLRCTWRDDDWPVSTQVELQFSNEGGRTKLALNHSGWQHFGDQGGSLCAAHRQGWEMHLANLKNHVEDSTWPKEA